MIYLDYSATTKVDEDILKTFNDVVLNYFANPNSVHKIAMYSNKLLEEANNQIAKCLNVSGEEIIYTSGASESNNLAIKGICYKYKNRGKHIISTPLEHSSVTAALNHLISFGYEVEYVELNKDGTVDLEDLKIKLRDDTILVTICAVDSELGIRQPIEEIGSILKNYPKCYFHTDMTQCLGKDEINLKDVDLASFSAHKIYCFKGIGGLYKKENLVIEPLIHGGRSLSVYRSGTPQTELIVSMSKAIRKITTNIKGNYNYVKNLNDKLRTEFYKYGNVIVNSTDKSIPHILNVSILGIKPETFVHALEKYDVYISTKSACSKSGESSVSVFSVTKDKERSSSSIRISISYKTTNEEIEEFINVFNKCYLELEGIK